MGARQKLTKKFKKRKAYFPICNKSNFENQMREGILKQNIYFKCNLILTLIRNPYLLQSRMTFMYLLMATK